MHEQVETLEESLANWSQIGYLLAIHVHTHL